MPKKNSKQLKNKQYGSIRRQIEAGKPYKIKNKQAARNKQLQKINYKTTAKKIRVFESLPFRNKVNFTTTQKRHIARRWKVIKFYRNIKPGPVAPKELHGTNAILSRGRVILYKHPKFRRIVRKWYILDTLRARKEYTIFLSQPEVRRIVGALSPLSELRAIVAGRRPRGFLLDWASGRINDEEVHYSWVYGAYPGGKLDSGSFDRYTVQQLAQPEQQRKITAIRLIYHVGGFDE